ncbi:Calcium ion binding [Balamuthia mandrillaris]
MAASSSAAMSSSGNSSSEERESEHHHLKPKKKEDHHHQGDTSDDESDEEETEEEQQQQQQQQEKEEAQQTKGNAHRAEPPLARSGKLSQRRMSGFVERVRKNKLRLESMRKKHLISPSKKNRHLRSSAEGSALYQFCLAIREGQKSAVVEVLEELKGSPAKFLNQRYAIKYGHDDLVAFMLDASADPLVKSLEYIEDVEGEEVQLHTTSKRPGDDCCRYRKAECRNAFHVAAQYGRAQLIELMLSGKRFAEKDLLNEHHNVITLAIKGKVGPQVARLLVQYDVNISGIPQEDTQARVVYETVTKRSKRATLLYAVKKLDDVDFIRFLITDVHLDGVNMRTFKNTTPTHIAAKYGSLNTLRYFLKNGAEVDPLDIRYSTPLCLALEKLAKMRNKLRQAQELDSQALQKANKECKDAFQIAEYLLDCNATVKYAKTSDGMSPLLFIVTQRIGSLMTHKSIQSTINKTWRLNLQIYPAWWQENWGYVLSHPKFRFWLSFLTYFAFLILFTVMMLLTNTDVHSEAFYFEKSLRVRTVGEQFYLDRPFHSRTGTPGDFKKYFADTDQVPEIWTWITGPLYLNFFVPETAFVMRYNRIVTNKMRLRQFRVEPGTCDLATSDYEALAVNGECYGEYSEENEFTGTYGPGGEGWTYSEPSDRESFISKLEELFPERGGYEVTLDTRDANATFTKLTELYENNWIDEMTRAVVIEFTVYNPNINLFSVVRIMWDMPRGGIVYPSSQFFTVKLLRYPFHMFFFLSMEIVIGIWVTVYVLIEIKEVIVEKRQYFLNGWNAVDVLMYVSFVVLAIFRFIEVGIVSSLDWEADDTDYVSFQRLARYRNYQFHVIALILVLGWAKLLKFLRVQQHIGVLLIVVNRMVRALFVWGSVFIVFILSFSIALFLLLGSTEWSYRATYWSMVTMFRTATGDGDFDVASQELHFGSIMLYLIYIIISSIMLLNLLIAMLSTSYAEVIEKANLEYCLNFAFLVLTYNEDYTKDNKFKRFIKQKAGKQYFDDETSRDGNSSDTELEEMAICKAPVPPPPSDWSSSNISDFFLNDNNKGRSKSRLRKSKRKEKEKEERNIIQFGSDGYSKILVSKVQRKNTVATGIRSSANNKDGTERQKDKEESFTIIGDEDEGGRELEGGAVASLMSGEIANLELAIKQLDSVQQKIGRSLNKLHKKMDDVLSRVGDDEANIMLL